MVLYKNNKSLNKGPSYKAFTDFALFWIIFNDIF